MIKSGLLMIAMGIITTSCGATPPATEASGAATPNTSPGTHTQGPIVIATNHRAYAPTDRIQVTLVNETSTSLYAYDHLASCSIFGLEIWQVGQWKDVSQTQPMIADCPLGRMTIQVTISPGGTYQAPIMAAYLHQGESRFPVGRYRVRLNYTTTPGGPYSGESSPSGPMHGNTTYSEILTVDASVPPEPLPTLPPPNTGAGTVSAGTAVPVGTTQP